MGVCGRCGTRIDGASVFCPGCGAVQTPAGSPGQQPPTAPPPAQGWGAPVPPPPPAQGWEASGWGTPPAQGPYAAQQWAQPGGWTAQASPGDDWEDEPEFEPTPAGRAPGQRDPKLLLLVLGVVGLVVVAGVVAFLLLSRHGSTRAAAAPSSSSASAPAASTPASSSAASSSAAGAVTVTPEEQLAAGAAPVPLVAAGADCTYPPSVDGKNQSVTYEPSKAVDGDATTAWRCPGAGGHTIRLTLGQAGSVSDLGLIPGYAKVDPATGVNRFTDNHTVTQVVWQLDEGGQPVRITQDIADPGPELAWVHLSRPVAASSISLTVTGVGNMEARQDSTPISTIEVASRPSR